MMSQALTRIAKFDHQSDLARAVCEHGWLHLRAAGSEAGLAAEASKLAQLLGEPMAGRKGHCVEILVPLHVENANTNSLSMQHGLDYARRAPVTTFAVANFR
jgi:hypothetical protein